ncbi:hypothetical protein ACIQPR_33575 [Streptomyces sp. NPDC091280]|uniref:Rv1733c family protein n=1 Tax=Streptomyces sp. NPDC091280 TaxID=3365984 RepID=UPI0037FFFCC2
MVTTRRTRTGKALFWRWRRNQLRRPGDRVEARIVLGAWFLALAAGLLAGSMTAAHVERSLEARRAELVPVRAVLTENAPRPTVVARFHSDHTVWATVRWTAADGTTRTGSAQVAPASVVGDRVTVWTDADGGLVGTPPSAAEARFQSDCLGASTGLAAWSVVLVCGRLVCVRLERRRLAEWATEWERIGPQWRKRMNG